MEDNKLRQKAFSNLLWRFAERCGAQGVSFVVSIILARLLIPELYGTIALVTVFSSILQVFVDSGLGTALIQKKDADELDFSSVFYFNFVMCIVLYAGIYIVAPHIALFYNDASLTPIIRVISLTLVVSGVKNVQQSYVSRNLLFKRFFFATLGGTIFSAILGIVMAYQGFGIWALVVQQLSNTAIDTLILWCTVKWRPKWMFSWSRLRGLLKFGGKLLISTLLDTGYSNFRSLIIGKIYTSADLAYYDRGWKFPQFIVSNINASIDNVLLPVMAKEQENVHHIRMMTQRSIKISTYVMAPLMIGLAVVAPALVRLLLTEKWLPCVPYLRIFCITYMFHPIHTANLSAINAMGRSDIFLKLEIVKKTMAIIVILIFIPFGVLALAYSSLLSGVLSQIINSWPNRKLLNYKYLEQIKDIMPGILLAMFMGLCISVIPLFNFPDIAILVVQVILGAVIYISGSIVFKLDSFQYLFGIIRSYIFKSEK